MAVEFISVASRNYSTDSITLAIPSGYQEGDLLICFVESANQEVTIPSGWAETPSSPIGTGSAGTSSGVRLTVFYKFASSSESSITVDDTGNHTWGVITCWRGVDSTTPFNASANDYDLTTTTTKTFPSVTTTVDGAMIINVVGLNRDQTSNNVISNWSNSNLVSITEFIDDTTTSGFGGGAGGAYGIKTSAGSTGQTTATLISTNIDVYITLALTPEGAIPTENYNLVGAVSQSSTVETNALKQSSLIGAVSQSSSVASSNVKEVSLVGAISQSSTVVSSLTKQESSEEYNLVGAISQSSEVSSALSKQVGQVAEISQSSEVASVGNKATSLINAISQDSAVQAENKKQTFLLGEIAQPSTVSGQLDKSVQLIAEISQGSVVYSVVTVVVSYDFDLVGSISQDSTVQSSLSKTDRLVANVNQASYVESFARKENQIIGSISQSSIVSSVNGKQTYILGNIEQSSLVSTLASKQVNQELSIEQLSELYSSLIKFEYTDTRIVKADKKTVRLDGKTTNGVYLHGTDRKSISMNTDRKTVGLDGKDRKVVKKDD